MRASFSCFALILLLPQCGGESAAGAEPKSGGDSAHSRDGSRDTATNADDDESSASASTPEKPAGPNCDDGTCSLCGSGICPAGWYCDEKASGGGACSWLTECADKPTCACVTRVLGANCKCREDGGSVKVSCD